MRSESRCVLRIPQSGGRGDRRAGCGQLDASSTRDPVLFPPGPSPARDLSEWGCPSLGLGVCEPPPSPADFPAGFECNSSVSREGMRGGGHEVSGEVQLKCWQEPFFQQCLGV